MPGVNVKLISAPAAQTDPTSTGKLFAVQLFERGSTTAPILVTSMTEFKELVGSRVAYSAMWDAAETFFEEGGSELILGRVVGKTPVAAKVELESAAKAKVLIVKAKSVGEWGNKLKAQVKKGEGAETYRLVILESETPVEESPDLKTQVEAVTWSEGSAYVSVTVGAGEGQPEVHAGVALTGGTYDNEHVETKDWEEALALFSPELGCGQVAAPGITTTAVAELLEKHAEANNRTALIDLTDSGTAGTLIAAAASLRSVVGARRSAAFAPWAMIPGLAAEAPRKVPYSSVQAGIIARNDASATPPPVGEASAGSMGRPRYAIGLSQPGWSRAVREELNSASVNVARVMPNGLLETYGNRTLVKPTVEPAWKELSAARLYMFIWAEGEAILEAGVFKNIDPKNKLFSSVEGGLAGFLGRLGSTLESWAVNTGPAVNTKATIAAGEVRADIEVKADEVAETATLNIAVGV